jgi:hypothetical protein
MLGEGSAADRPPRVQHTHRQPQDRTPAHPPVPRQPRPAAPSSPPAAPARGSNRRRGSPPAAPPPPPPDRGKAGQRSGPRQGRGRQPPDRLGGRRSATLKQPCRAKNR